MRRAIKNMVMAVVAVVLITVINRVLDMDKYPQG